jgi:hypothetical protein
MWKVAGTRRHYSSFPFSPINKAAVAAAGRTPSFAAKIN